MLTRQAPIKLAKGSQMKSVSIRNQSTMAANLHHVGPQSTSHPTHHSEPFTLGSFLADRAERFEFRDCLKDPKRKMFLTYSDLKIKADALAEGLLSNQLQGGQKMLCCLEHSLKPLVAQLASSSIGLPFVVGPSHPSVEELQQMLKKSNARAVILDPKTYDEEKLNQVFPELQFSAIGVPFRSESFPNLRVILHGHPTLISGALYFNHAFTYNYIRPRVGQALKKVNPSDPAIIEYSFNGKTLQETVHTHQEVLNTASLVQHKFGLTESDRVVLGVSFASPKTYSIGAYSTFLVGGNIVVPQKLDAQEVVNTLKETESSTLIVSGSLFANYVVDKKHPLTSAQKALIVDPDPKTEKTVRENLHNLGFKNIASFKTQTDQLS